MIIRRPQHNEKEAINEFFELVLRDTFEKNDLMGLSELLNEEIIDKAKQLQTDLDSQGAETYFLIAWEDETVVGTIACGPANSAILEHLENSGTEQPEIGTVFVHPDYQSRGIGSLLIHEMMTVLHSKGFQWACLDSGYPSAQKIWSYKFGEPQCLLKDFWGPGADHMIWRFPVMTQMI